MISLKKLKEGLEIDTKADQLLKSINDDVISGSLKPETIFNKFDFNKNVKLELREFKTLVRELTNNYDNMPVIEALFHKLDINGDYAISLKEFNNKITGDGIIKPASLSDN